jgi:hypothetical protein
MRRPGRRSICLCSCRNTAAILARQARLNKFPDRAGPLPIMPPVTDAAAGMVAERCDDPRLLAQRSTLRADRCSLGGATHTGRRGMEVSIPPFKRAESEISGSLILRRIGAGGASYQHDNWRQIRHFQSLLKAHDAAAVSRASRRSLILPSLATRRPA